MRYQFLAQQPFDDDSSRDDISTIIMSIAHGWNSWYWPDPTDYADTVYFRLLAVHLEVAVKSFTAEVGYGPAGGGVMVFVLASDQEPTPKQYRLAPNEAAILASRPLAILVENRINDGAVLLAMLGSVDIELAARFEGPRPSLIWEHGGGKAEILKLIELHTQRAMNDGLPCRIFAIVDSDASFPGQVNAATRRLIEQCAASCVGVHVLHKRAIENYVSDRVLQNYASQNLDVAPAVATIIGFTSQQRDHFPIKSGLPNTLNQQEKVLYSGLDIEAAASVRLPRLVEYMVGSGQLPSGEDLANRSSSDEVAALAQAIWGYC